MGVFMVCCRMGGYLASFNTEAEWRNVVDVLRMKRSLHDIYIGITTAPPSFLNM